MKKIITIILAAAAMIFAGCDQTQDLTVEKMTTVSTLIGRTAAMTVELTKTKDEVKTAITTVLDAVAIVVPATNQTFAAAWEGVIAKNVQALVDAKKLTADQASVVKSALYVASEGIDLVFTRYPAAKNAKDLVSAAVKGFTEGFKAVVTSTGVTATAEFDKEAFEILKKKLAEKK